jgi:hypothetical protein
LDIGVDEALELVELGAEVRTKFDRQSQRDGTEEREEPFSMMKSSVLCPIDWFTCWWVEVDVGVCMSLIDKM